MVRFVNHLHVFPLFNSCLTSTGGPAKSRLKYSVKKKNEIATSQALVILSTVLLSNPKSRVTKYK